MSLVNVGMAIEMSLATQLAMNLHYNEDGTRMADDITDEEARQLSLYASGHWKDVTSPNNQKTYRIISFYVPRTPVSEEDPKLALVESVIEKIKIKKSKTDDLTVIGAWDKDGSQYGTTLTKVKIGTEQVEVMEPVWEDVPTGAMVWDYTDPENPVEVLKMVEYEEGLFRPETKRTITSYIGTGVFETVDVFGEQVEGVPVYPINPLVLACMPDDVTYQYEIINGELVAIKGSETYTPATQPKEVCKLAGWKDRRWS